MSETPEDDVQLIGRLILAEFEREYVEHGMNYDPDTCWEAARAVAPLVASLRQRQEELQAENDALGEQYAEACADYETLVESLRTQLQQAEQERDAHHERASDNAARASTAEHRERMAESQLQQAETAQRDVSEGSVPWMAERIVKLNEELASVREALAYVVEKRGKKHAACAWDPAYGMDCDIARARAALAAPPPNPPKESKP